MKKTLRRLLAMCTVVSVLLLNTISIVAAEEYKEGTGNYTVVVSNGSGTGISIAGDVFHAYQIFEAADVTSYSVTDGFRDFFKGTTMTAGDGSGVTYDFQSYLNDIVYYEDLADDGNLTPDDEAAYETALINYNQLAGHYMNSYENNMYTLAEQIRAFLDQYGAYNDSGTIECMAHSTASAADANGYEYAYLNGLDTGYYFVIDQESTLSGIGIAASGAFVPLTTSSEFTTTISVKESVPTMTKNIYHDDASKWDIVGDSQIGDTVEFRIISTLPSNIDDYTNTEKNATAIGTYTYIITDTMSEGLTYNGDVTVYTDSDATHAVTEEYLDIVTTETGFILTVDVIQLMEDNTSVMTLYTYYSATLNEDAVVASDYDKNTATLKYSNNPSEEDAFGEIESTVFHYTFDLEVNKVDESGNGLAGARFGLFDEEGYAIPLSEGETDTTTGVVSYYYDADAETVSDGGYITTREVTLDNGSTVIGKFQIYGLNDQTYYTLKEVEAPDGYNTADQFEIYFTVDYNTFGTSITYMADGSAYVNTSQDNSGDWSSTSTIINRMKIYLPETGGMGTVVFRVGGGVLMIGALVMLFKFKPKKEEQ